MSWSRDTPWRQGHILTDDAAQALSLVACDVQQVAVVVTHDCDLAQDPGVEASVEVIVGSRLSQPDGNFAHAKNVRCLHLTFSAGREALVVQLDAGAKTKVPKGQLHDYAPSDQARLSVEERNTLQRWLALRYRRSAFPDEFDRRLSDLGLRDLMAKALRADGMYVSAVYLDLDKGQEVGRDGRDDPYELSIHLLYKTDKDAVIAKEAALRAAKSIEEAFIKKCRSKTDGVWTWIELIECDAISDQAMTVHQVDSFARWSADHLSLRSSPQGTMRHDD